MGRPLAGFLKWVHTPQRSNSTDNFAQKAEKAGSYLMLGISVLAGVPLIPAVGLVVLVVAITAPLKVRPPLRHKVYLKGGPKMG